MILLPKSFKKRYEKIDPPLKLIALPYVAYLFDLSYENTENRRFVNWFSDRSISEPSTGPDTPHHL